MKRLSSLFLAIVLLVTMLPVIKTNTFAADGLQGGATNLVFNKDLTVNWTWSDATYDGVPISKVKLQVTCSSKSDFSTGTAIEIDITPHEGYRSGKADVKREIMQLLENNYNKKYITVSMIYYDAENSKKGSTKCGNYWEMSAKSSENNLYTFDVKLEGNVFTWTKVTGVSEYSVGYFYGDNQIDTKYIVVKDTKYDVTPLVEKMKTNGYTQLNVFVTTGNYTLSDYTKVTKLPGMNNIGRKTFILDGLVINGVYVTDKNAKDVLGDGTVEYDKELHTVYLRNAVLSKTVSCGMGSTLGDTVIYYNDSSDSPSTLKIYIIGNNKINIPYSGDASYAIANSANFAGAVFSGPGILNITYNNKGKKVAVVSNVCLIIDNASVNIDIKNTSANGIVQLGNTMVFDTYQAKMNIKVEADTLDMSTYYNQFNAYSGSDITFDVTKVKNWDVDYLYAGYSYLKILKNKNMAPYLNVNRYSPREYLAYNQENQTIFTYLKPDRTLAGLTKGTDYTVTKEGDYLRYKGSGSCLIDFSIEEKCTHPDDYEMYEEPTCAKKGYVKNQCATCSHSTVVEEVPATGKHIMGIWSVVKESTKTTTGLKTRKCLTCDKTETAVIPKNPKSPVSVYAQGTAVKDKKYKYNVTKEAVYNGKVKKFYGEVQITGFRTKAQKKKQKTIKIATTVTIDGVIYNVTSVGKKAFANSKKASKVYVGKNVKSIGAKAFAGSKKIKKVVINSKKLKKIGKKAFAGLKRGAVIKVPKSKKKAYKKLVKRSKAGKVKVK